MVVVDDCKIMMVKGLCIKLFVVLVYIKVVDWVVWVVIDVLVMLLIFIDRLLLVVVDLECIVELVI